MATCGEVLIELLEAYGVEVVFGIPGVHNVELYRGLSRSTIRHVTPRHEQGAGFMADGYARVTGKPGVCFTITGPGLTNILTAMGQAYADSIPMLVISSCISRSELNSAQGRLHELPSQRDLARGVSALSYTVLSPDQLPEIVARAFALFAGGRPRPVYIEIPVDVIAMPADHLPRAPRPLPHRPLPPATDIAAAAEAIRAAKQPMLVVGGGAVGAPAAVRAFAERLDAPTILTINARGLLPPAHPLIAGELLTNPPLKAALEAADLVVAVGTEFGETEMYPVPEVFTFAGTLVRIDIDPDQVTRPSPADVPLVGDAGATLEALHTALGPATGAGDGAVRAAGLRQASARALPPGTDVYERVMAAIDAALPDAVIVGDSTQTVYFANQFYRPKSPRSFFNSSTGYGTLGYAVPAAVGARLGTPKERPVVVLVGDGGILFTIGELAAAVEARAAIVIVVWNNDGYGEIRNYMRGRQIAPIGTDLLVPDLVAIAKGFGCAAERVESRAALADALTRAGDFPLPTLIEIREDADFLKG